MTLSDRTNIPAASGDLPKPVALVSCDLARRVGTAVMLAVGVTAVGLAAFTAIEGRALWWIAFLSATLVALAASATSLIVIRQAVGRAMSLLPAMTMLLSAVRLGVCLGGLVVATEVFKSPADATGVMICVYYTAILFIESVVIHRALSKLNADRMNAEGKLKQ